jgi:hypothetical protein
MNEDKLKEEGLRFNSDGNVDGLAYIQATPAKVFPLLFHFTSDMVDKMSQPIVGLPFKMDIAATIEDRKLVLVNWKGERVEIAFE